MSFIVEQVNRLMGGTEGSNVIQTIKDHYNTSYSFEKHVSLIRRKYLLQNTRHAEYEKDIDQIKCALSNQCANLSLFEKFCSLTLADQYDAMKRMKKKGFFHDKELDAKFFSIRLLRDNMISFKIDSEDMETAHKNKRNTLLNRNANIVNVENLQRILETQIKILEKGSHNKIDEIIALLFVSGRRESEILNGQSVFQLVENRPYHIKFTGVLKKKRNPLETKSETVLTIPLLCKADIFLAAYLRMQSLQKTDITTMTNKQISNRYCSQLSNARKRIFPMISKTHDLRGLYAKCVDTLFEHNVSFPYLCMQCLGQDVMEDTLHYMSIRLDDVSALNNANGNLCLEEFDQNIR